MRRRFNQHGRQVAWDLRWVLVVASTATILPTPGWAHSCSSRDLAIETGETVEYVITGSDRLVLFDIHEAGDPLVVKIVAPKEIDQNDLVFKITGAGPGTTEFRVYWEGPDRGDICKVKIIVSG